MVRRTYLPSERNKPLPIVFHRFLRITGRIDSVKKLVLATALDERPALIAEFAKVPLRIVDDLPRKQPTHPAEELKIVLSRYERASTIVTSNRPLEDSSKLYGDTPTFSVSRSPDALQLSD